MIVTYLLHGVDHGLLLDLNRVDAQASNGQVGVGFGDGVPHVGGVSGF